MNKQIIKNVKPEQSDDDDDCEIVTVSKVKPTLLSPDVKLESLPIQNESSDDDDVQLIKVERIRQPAFKLPDQIMKKLEKIKNEEKPQASDPSVDPLIVSKYFPCSLCKKIFATAIDLIQHSAHHEKKKKKNKREPGTGTGDYECSICQIKFEKQVSLAAHMNVHRDRPGEKQFKCRTCDETFKSNGSLWNHRKSKHMEKVYRCNTCCKTFALESSFNDHMKKHEEEGEIQCEICYKTFTLHSSLKTHMRLHTGDLPYLCSECGKSFNTSNRLAEHLRRHSGVRKYECNVCSKKFFEKADLKKHTFLHTGERPHTCDICGKGFILAVSLRVHMRSHTGERPYACELSDICQKRFITQSQMKRHVRTHTGDRPHACTMPGCHKTFRQLTDLSRHMRKMHDTNIDDMDSMEVLEPTEFDSNLMCESKYQLEEHIAVHFNRSTEESSADYSLCEVKEES